MDPFFRLKDCVDRSLERKRTLIVCAVLFVAVAVLGACVSGSSAFHGYLRRGCVRYVEGFCFSDGNFFLLVLKRLGGCLLLLLLLFLGGIHPVAMVLPAIVLFCRAFVFGGSLVLFFSVYEVTGAVVVFVLYLPIHLLLDALFLLTFALSCARSARFCFSKADFGTLISDYLCFLFGAVAISLLEGVLLLALFHPLGNLL